MKIFGKSGLENWLEVCLVVCLILFSLQTAASFEPSSEPISHAEVQAMAPLLIYDPRSDLPVQKINEILNEFSHKLFTLKNLGVTGITVDVWWGIVQARSQNDFEWSYYDLVFERITRAGLNIIPVMSFHMCGSNVGDSFGDHVTYIPLPRWLRELMPTLANGEDSRYQSESGNWSEEVISSFATHSPRTNNRLHPLDLYSRFFKSFLSHFPSLASNIPEFIFGLGPAGELTYPSYHKHDELVRWNGEALAAYPNRGTLQASSPYARRLFYQWLEQKYSGGSLLPIEALNKEWATNYKSFQDIDFFVTTEKFEAFLQTQGPSSPAGKAFFQWDNQNLIEHGIKVSDELAQALKGTAFEDKILAIKMPGVHWRFHDKLAMLTAGQISAEELTKGKTEDIGYLKTFSLLFGELVRKNPRAKWKSIFTCADQANCSRHDVEGSGDLFKLEAGKQTHGAFDLVRAVGGVLKQLGIRGGLENSLAFLLKQPHAVSRIYSHLSQLSAFQSVTLLRMDDVIESHFAQDLVKSAIQLPKTEPVSNRKLLCSEALTQ